MPNYDHRVTVQPDKRVFVVEFDSDGEPLRIKERKNKKPPMAGVYDTQIWSAKSNGRGGSHTLPERIINLARQKLRREHEADIATP